MNPESEPSDAYGSSMAGFFLSLSVFGALFVGPLGAGLLAACSQWSWNPKDWFASKPEPAPAPVDLLSIQSESANATGERFVQTWEGARLVVDVYSG
jgi:hypothetical protein